MRQVAYGPPFPHGLTSVGSGIRTPQGLLLSTGGNVAAYVDSGRNASQDAPDITRNSYTTLNAALGKCRSGAADIVVVMSGHAENISSADQMSNLVAGTRIIGLGYGSNRPTFTWTAATATLLLDVADVSIENCILQMASSGNSGVTVAAPITVSAANCSIRNCLINFGDDANDLVTIGVTTTTAANRFEFSYNRCIGATAAECTTFLQVVGGDSVSIVGNYISGATSAVDVGIVRVLGTASTNMLIWGNYLANNLASSEEALTLLASTTGFMDHNHLAVLDNASVAMDTVGNITMGNQNTLANTVGERGLVLGTASA